MRTVTKTVYYCEHCKRHRLTAASIEKHEPRCIYNPRRSACGWHPETRPSAPVDVALVFKDDPDVSRLRHDLDGCPACMLAVVVQARQLGLHDEHAWEFDYAAEVTKYREAERRADAF